MTKLLVSSVPTVLTSSPYGEPWARVDHLFDRLSRELLPSFGPGEGGWPALDSDSFAPARADVEEKSDSYVVRADLPGVPKDKIDVRVQGNLVTISAENTVETADESKAWLRRERNYVGFRRFIELPEPVLADKVQAQYTDGVLHLTVPKAHPVTEQKVTVQ